MPGLTACHNDVDCLKLDSCPPGYKKKNLCCCNAGTCYMGTNDCKPLGDITRWKCSSDADCKAKKDCHRENLCCCSDGHCAQGSKCMKHMTPKPAQCVPPPCKPGQKQQGGCCIL